METLVSVSDTVRNSGGYTMLVYNFQLKHFSFDTWVWLNERLSLLGVDIAERNELNYEFVVEVVSFVLWIWWYMPVTICTSKRKSNLRDIVVSRGAVRSAASSYAMRMVAGCPPPPPPTRPRHSVGMTYRPSAALRLLGSLRISHNKFLRGNKWILILIYVFEGNTPVNMYQ